MLESYWLTNVLSCALFSGKRTANVVRPYSLKQQKNPKPTTTLANK